MKEKNSITQEELAKSMQELDITNNVPLLGNVSNSGSMRKIGKEFQAVGKRDFTDPKLSSDR